MIKLLGTSNRSGKDYVVRGLELFKVEDDRIVYIKNDKNDSDKFSFYYVYPVEKLIYVFTRRGKREVKLLSGFLHDTIEY
tara:strand:- start:457 stop:696 length:240 start_codon:yes stop_codon:yes gene_type:complete